MHGVLTPAQSDSLAAASAKIIADAKAPAASKPADATVAKPDKVEAPAADGVVSGAGGSADKAQAPAKPDALDLSFLPESVRSKVHVDDDHALAALKSGYMAHGEATKKFQEAAALRRSAENYDFLMADPDLAAVVVKAVADKQAGRKPSEAPTDTPEPEIDPFDPKSVASEIDRRAEVKASEKIEAFRKELDAPNVWRAKMNEAIGSYAASHAVEEAVMIEAVKLAAADFQAEGFTPQPDDVARLMGPYVRLARVSAKPAVAPPVNNLVESKNGRPGTEAVTSPTGRGGPHTASVLAFPSHWKNGVCPLRETDEQATASHLYRMRARYGPDVTLEDVRAGSEGR